MGIKIGEQTIDGEGGVAAGAVGAELLAATTEAEAQSALGVTASPGARIEPTFATGQGWTIVAGTGGTASLTTASGSPVGRITMATSADIHGLTGPRIERAMPICEVFKITVRLRSKTITGNGYVGLYLRDAAGSSAHVIFALPNGSVAGMTPAWSISGPGSAGEVTFDATCFLGLRGLHAAHIRRGTINGSGVWTARDIPSLVYTPSHVGICGLADASGPASGSYDLDQFVLETLG